ncbi:hypothetical protein [Vibrio phage XM1]|nr:hypothetical protein [Vibrio phage XM1]
MKIGKIVEFYVTAQCPNCENETWATEAEVKHGFVTCQHCDEEFKIILE